MPAAIDLTGKKYGRLTAISLDRLNGKRRWLFRCDCGNTKTLNAAYVCAGTTRSCGCLRRETTAATRFKDLTGRRIGRLTVICRLPNNDIHKHIRWQCLCDCGNTTVTTTLGSKRPTKSCGCIRAEQMRALGASHKQENPVSRTVEYRKSQKAKRRLNPTVAMSERMSRLMAWALASVGAIKRSATFDLLGYTPAQLKTHIEKQFVSGMSWANRSKWEVDHITPISTARCEADVIALNQLSNLRPLWALDNNRKNCRPDRLI